VTQPGVRVLTPGPPPPHPWRWPPLATASEAETLGACKRGREAGACGRPSAPIAWAPRTACDGRSAGRRGPRGPGRCGEGPRGGRRGGCGARPAAAGPGPEPCRPARPGPAEAAAPLLQLGRTRSKLPELPGQSRERSGETPCWQPCPRTPPQAAP
jgi:hypothetical protein